MQALGWIDPFNSMNVQKPPCHVNCLQLGIHCLAAEAKGPATSRALYHGVQSHDHPGMFNNVQVLSKTAKLFQIPTVRSPWFDFHSSGALMLGKHLLIRILLLSSVAMTVSSANAQQPVHAPTPSVGVGAQYDTAHVYVAPDDVDKFVASFLATFGGHSTKQVVATVTPTPSSTTSQLLQTPVGSVSLFGFKTPIPYPFGAERTGYLVTDMAAALRLAKAAGADVLVAPFPDPIGVDAVIQWPGGVNMQLYWHTTKPSYAAFMTVPENRVYVSAQRAQAFTRSFLHFSRGKVVSDDRGAPGAQIGRPKDTYRRVQIESVFGAMVIFVTDGHLPYPYGREVTGYGVADLQDTLAKATKSGATMLVAPLSSGGRDSAIVQFPGGYIAEIHAAAPAPD
jgi:predicted enzyme related to lactoylglutathione lyase